MEYYLSTDKIHAEIKAAESSNDWPLIEILLAIHQKRAEISILLQKVEKYKAGELWVRAGE